MRKPYADKTLFGVHVGEHGFFEDKVMDEIKEYVEKGVNFITIRPPRKRKIEEHYYYDWARYMAANEVYFIFLYALQFAPEGEVSHITPSMNEKLKEIAGKYYLGDMLGETGSTYACKLQGYFRNAKIKVEPPKQGAADMKEAKENYSAVLKDLVERERETGVPNVSTVEATMLNNYNVEMGVDMPFSELLCGDPEIIVPALRGTARAYGSKLWGTYIAHEWYGGMRHFDKLKDARLELIYKYAYMSGSEAFCLESGLDRITSYGTSLPDENPISIKNREVFYRICDYIANDERPSGGPLTRVAFVQGNYDAFGGGWGGSSLWSQFEGEKWGHSNAESGWRIIDDINKKRDWWEPDSYEAKGLDVSGALADGSYDIIPATASAEAMKRYDCLIFTGWNTMTESIAENLLEYVENGGKLIIAAAHLNTNPDRAGKPEYLNNDAVKKLLGCTFTGKSISSNLGMRFVSDSAIPNMHYPYANLRAADPIYSKGYVKYADVELCGGEVRSILSDSFLVVEDELDAAPTLVENKCGDGYVVFFTSEYYPGNNAVYPMYRSVVREMLRAETEGEPQLVLAPSAVRFAMYDGGILYLLNTDKDLPVAVVILPESDMATTMMLKPLELMKLRIENDNIELLSSI